MDICEIENNIKTLENSIKNKYDTGVNGVLVDRYIVCGKSGCKCRTGKKHGPYPHIQVYDKNRKLHGIYIGNKKRELYEKRLEDNKDFFKKIKELNKLYLLRRDLKWSDDYEYRF